MRLLNIVWGVFLAMPVLAQEKGIEFIKPADIYKVKTIGAPKISPEGNWVLYTVRTMDSVKDKYKTQLFMTDVQGKNEPVPLTQQTESPANYQWSPDGKFISFMAKSKSEILGSGGRQLWLMDRRGGEPQQLTSIAAEIENYQWSPDGQKILFQITDANNADTAATKIRKPFEIDRYHFKDDMSGYLDNRKTHLYIYNNSTKKIDSLTRGVNNEGNAKWAPDGQSIFYESNITENPDRNSNSDIFQISTDSSKKIIQHTTFNGPDSKPTVSPDQQWLAYMESLSAEKFNMYIDNQPQLWLKNLKNGERVLLTEGLDRPISEIVWAKDSKYIYAIVSDDRKQLIMEINVATKSRRWLTEEKASYASLDINLLGTMVFLKSDPQTPKEIYAYDQGKIFQVSTLQKNWAQQFKKIQVKGFEFTSTDKTSVSGILFTSDTIPSQKPLIIFIHGGPVSQDDYGYDITRHILAGAGYTVAAVNYRGSNGRGVQFSKSIQGDWGNKEVDDIIHAANYLVKEGWVDEKKMALGGWSYGGITTNYTIAKDTRFKAAVSGAGSALQMTMYGTDQYVLQYDEELGAPWQNPQKWMQLSYPYFNVQKIKTPTLFMASEDDFNVPVAGAEQMYQAFKGAGIPTELVIYPGQHHGVAVPSYIVHRLNQYIRWYAKYLK